MNTTYGPSEMTEDYRVILSNCKGDKARARVLFEAYLAGRNGMMPPRRNWQQPHSVTPVTRVTCIYGTRVGAVQGLGSHGPAVQPQGSQAGNSPTTETTQRRVHVAPR